MVDLSGATCPGSLGPGDVGGVRPYRSSTSLRLSFGTLFVPGNLLISLRFPSLSAQLFVAVHDDAHIPEVSVVIPPSKSPVLLIRVSLFLGYFNSFSILHSSFLPQSCLLARVLLCPVKHGFCCVL